MTVGTLEKRLNAMEAELVQIKQQLAAEKASAAPHPWEKIFGSFADSAGFEEAVRLGREYREAQHSQDEETA